MSTESRGDRARIQGLSSFVAAWRASIPYRSVLAAIVALIAVCISMRLSSWSFAFREPVHHWAVMDKLYTWVDPFGLYLLSGWMMIFLLVRGAESKSSSQLLRKLGESLILLFLLTVFLFALESILKDTIRRSRPITQLEHGLVAERLEGSLSSIQLQALRSEHFICPVARVVLAQDNRMQGPTWQQEEIIRKLTDSGMSTSEATKHLASIVRRTGIVPVDIGTDQEIQGLQAAHRWVSHGHYPFLVHFLLRDKYECSVDNAAPSGHILRQGFVLFLSLLLVFYLRHRLPFARLSKGSRNVEVLLLVSYVAMNLAFLAWAGWSRWYGYWHTFSDEMLSLGITFFLFLFASVVAAWQYPAGRVTVTSVLRSLGASNLMNQIGALVVLVSRNGEVLLWNKQAEVVTGYKAKEIRNLEEYISKLYPSADDKAELTKRLRKVIDTGCTDRNMLTEITTKSGSSKLILWNAAPISDPERQTVAKLSIGVEVGRLERRLTDIGLAATALLHDVRADARDMVIALEDMDDSMVGDGRIRDDLLKRARDILEIATDVREYVAGGPTQPAQVSLSRILDSAVRMIGAHADQSGVRICRQANGSHLTVKGSEVLLRHALVGLLRNAVDAVSARLASDQAFDAEVRISLQQKKDRSGCYAVIEVSDNGAGLPPAIRELVEKGPMFDELSESHLGNGLGLLLADGAARRHGGHLVVRQRQGGGTIVSIRLPILEEKGPS